MENATQIRASRTSVEQLEALKFNAGKNSPKNTKYMEEKCEELVGKLNILKSLTHWKYQLKSRARKIREEMLITGGGKSTTTSMSGLEERALHLFGIITVRGDDDIAVMGFENTIHNSTQEETNAVTPPNIDIPTPSIQIEPMPSQSTISPPNTTPRARKRQYSNIFSSAISDCVAKIRKLADDRAKQEKELAEQARMAEAMYILANSFKNKQ